MFRKKSQSKRSLTRCHVQQNPGKKTHFEWQLIKYERLFDCHQFKSVHHQMAEIKVRFLNETVILAFIQMVIKI